MKMLISVCLACVWMVIGIVGYVAIINHPAMKSSDVTPIVGTIDCYSGETLVFTTDVNRVTYTSTGVVVYDTNNVRHDVFADCIITHK